MERLNCILMKITTLKILGLVLSLVFYLVVNEMLMSKYILPGLTKADSLTNIMSLGLFLLDLLIGIIVFSYSIQYCKKIILKSKQDENNS